MTLPLPQRTRDQARPILAPSPKTGLVFRLKGSASKRGWTFGTRPVTRRSAVGVRTQACKQRSELLRVQQKRSRGHRLRAVSGRVPGSESGGHRSQQRDTTRRTSDGPSGRKRQLQSHRRACPRLRRRHGSLWRDPRFQIASTTLTMRRA